MPPPPDTCHERLLSLIEFARREGWEARLTDDRLSFVKAGLPPIFTRLPLPPDALRRLPQALPKDRHV
jgi:hypothetical protein